MPSVFLSTYPVAVEQALFVLGYRNLRVHVGWSLHSRLGQGGCFRRHLPGAMCVHRAASPASGLFDLAPIHPHGWLTRRRLLLVDDFPMIQQEQVAGYMALFKPVDAALLASTLRPVLDRRSAEWPQ